MSFVCTLNPDWDTATTRFKLEPGEEETIVKIPIGFADDRTFSVWVSLSHEPGYGELRHELSFWVVDVVDGEEPTFRRDGLDTQYSIPGKADRSSILGAICYATKVLIDDVRPSEVVMSTRVPDLPDKALAKYYAVCHVFAESGYNISKPDPYHGRIILMMSKHPAT